MKMEASLMTKKSIIPSILIEGSWNSDLKKESNHYPSWQLSDRQICDLELILNGGFSPLNGFMNRNDYESVLSDVRLADGALWPMPIAH